MGIIHTSCLTPADNAMPATSATTMSTVSTEYCSQSHRDISLAHLRDWMTQTLPINSCVLWTPLRVIKVLITSVSKTIRKPPLAEAQTALGKQKINKIRRKTIYNIYIFIHHEDGSTVDIIQFNKIYNSGGWNYFTRQCDMWLWDHMPLNSPKRPLYWNSTSGFDSDNITVVGMSFCTSLRNFIQIGPPTAEKNTSCRFLRF